MIELLWTYRGFLQTAVVVAIFLLALRRGGAPEVWCSAILLGAIILARANEIASEGLSTWTVAGFASDDAAYVLLDLMIFLALTTVGLRANRIYPLWMAGVQLTALLTHVAERTTSIVSPLAYAILNLSTFYLAIAFLAAGVIAHMRRAKSWGQYPSWRRDLRRSQAQMRWWSPTS